MKTSSLVLFGTLIMTSCATSGSKSTSNVLNHEDARKIGDAVQTENTDAMKAIFSRLPANPSDRSASDAGLLNQALQMTAAKGDKCNLEIAQYLYGMGAYADYFSMNKLEFSFDSELRKYKIPMCGTYLLDSHQRHISQPAPEWASSAEDYMSRIKANFIEQSYSALVQFLNASESADEKFLRSGLKAYEPVTALAIQYGKEACIRDSASASCISYGYYRKLPTELLEKKKAPPKSSIGKALKGFSEHIAALTR